MVKKKVSRREEKVSFPIKRIVLCSLIGGGIYFIMLFVFAFAELSMGLGIKFYMPIGLILGAFTSFLGGFTALYKVKEKAFQYGSLAGLIQAFICITVLFFINGSKGGTGIFILFAVMVAASVAGAVVSANMKVRNKY